MSKKTITNISGFVIIFLIALASSGCTFVSSGADVPATGQTYLPPVVVGTIRSTDITESSGLAASRCQNNVLWTHNDSGDDAFIFALDVKGNALGTWKVSNATNVDWEDIASYKDKAGKCYLYIGEIGDNKTKRPEHIVYRISEPIVTPSSAVSTRKEPLSTAVAEEIRFIYPDYNQDAETLLVHPQTAALYVVTKRVSGPAGVYRILPDFESGETQKAEAVGQLAVPAIPNGLVTGGDISPDGKHLIICDYTRAYEFSVPANAANFDEIWKQDAIAIDVGQRKVGEAICYSVDGNSVFATSEKKDPPLIEIKRRK